MKIDKFLIAILLMSNQFLINLKVTGQADLDFNCKSLGIIDFNSDQASGIVWITDEKDVWVHNDNWGGAELDKKNKIFKLDLNAGDDGQLNISKTLTINDPNILIDPIGNPNQDFLDIDWEDITKDENNHVYIGNFGSGNEGISRILKIPDPNTLGNSVTPEIIYFEYPKINGIEVVKDTEAMFYYNSNLYLFSKRIATNAPGYESEGHTYLFRISNSINTQNNPHLAVNLGGFVTDPTNTGNPKFWRVTGADISPDNKTVALLCQQRLWLFTSFNGDDFFEGESRYLDFELNGNPFGSQKEGIAFVDNHNLYICEDGPSGDIEADNRFFHLGICNMIGNGGFDHDKIGCWNFDVNSTAIASWNTINERANVIINNGSDAKWKVKLYQSGINFEQNKTYEISFDAKAGNAKDIFCKLSANDNSITYNNQNIALQSFWKHYTIYFTMDDLDDSNGKITFGLGGLGEDDFNVVIDNVIVKAYACGLQPCANLIKNGHFTINKDYFNLFVHQDAQANFFQSDGGQYLSINIENGSDAKWKVQLRQDGIWLKENKTYNLKFRANANSAKQVYAKIISAIDNTVYMPAKNFNVSNDWQEFEFSFTMPAPEDINARLVFAVGENNIKVRFDDISLTNQNCDALLCAESLVHLGEIQEGTYQVEDHIESTGKINVQTGLVEYKANNKITLGSGFTTSDTQSNFRAIIDICE